MNTGWIPYRVKWDGDSPLFEWLFVGSKSFSEPFFEETIISCRLFKENRERVVSSGAELLAIADSETDTGEPDCVIFHVSRCGSTLLSQLLTTDDSNIVLSEVPILDELLSFERMGVADADKYFRAVVCLLGRAAKQKRIILKMDSWHLGYYGKLRTIFPKALFVLLFREPDAVLRSHNRQAGIQSVKGTAISELFFSSDELEAIHAAEYFSHLLAEYYRMIRSISLSDNNAIAYDYAQGILELIELIYEKCSFPYADGIKANMQNRMQFHSKRKSDVFVEAGSVANHFRLTTDAIDSYMQLCQATERIVYAT